MRLPHPERAEIPAEKLRDYLLSTTHPIGRHKSVFFRGLGYGAGAYARLAEDLRSILGSDAHADEPSEYGIKYLVRGVLHGTNGRSAEVVTVWIILRGEDTPRFVTAYPED